MSTSIIPGPNVFRAVSGSLFSSPVNWSRGVVPTGSDVAMIADNCTIDISRTIGSLVVRAPFTASVNTGLNFEISNVLNVLGHLSSSGIPNLFSSAAKNIITSFQQGSSNFYYNGAVPQSIAGATYNNLYIRNSSGSKIANGNIIVSGTLDIVTSSFDLGSYNLIVSGTTNVGQGFPRAILSKTKPGNITFLGPVFLAGSNNGGIDAAFDMSGNPNIELRNGFRFNTNAGYFFSGYGAWTFTTNTQQVRIENAAARPREFNGPIVVSGSIGLTFDAGTNTGEIYPNEGFILRNNVNGTEAASTCSVANGNLLFVGDVTTPMKTGSFNYLVDSTAIGFISNNNFTLPYTNYKGLILGGSGAPILSGALTASYLRIGYNYIGGPGTFDLQSQNAYISGAIYITTAVFQKSGPGNILIGGNMSMTSFNVARYNFTGHPSVELRGGLTWNNGNLACYSGTGSWRFTTNNQSIGQFNSANTQTFDCPITIENVAVTYSYSDPWALIFNNVINSSGSGLFLNRGSIYFGTSQSLSGSFLSGTGFDFASSNTNTVYVGGNYTETIPARFNTFYGLGITGIGVKTLGTSSYVSGALNLSSNGVLELSSSNLIVSGTTNILNGCILQKSGSGNVIFNGPLWFNNAAFGNTSKLDFSKGNPTVEVRNGIQNSFNSFVTASMITGTGSWIFSANNQTIGNGGTAFRFDSPITISGSIAVTQSSFNAPNQTIVYLYNTINGTSPSSVYRMDGPLYLYYNSVPMITGSLDISGPFANLGFMFSESVNLPFTTYPGLTIAGGGTSTKTITSSIYVSRSLTVNGASASFTTLELGNFDLYVSGTTRLNYGKLSKSGPGKITFVGSFATDTIAADQARLNLSGNPIVEFQNGFGMFFSPWFEFNSGTGSWIFTTNDQSLNGESNTNIVISGSVIVSGAINLTHNTINQNGATLTLLGPLDGTVVGSKFTGRQIVYYHSSIEPMRTGSMDVSSSINATFIYNTGSQDVKGGTYRNLTFLNGLKTLQGNVSVLGTFSTGSGATSGSYNLNGFTLTNP